MKKEIYKNRTCEEIGTILEKTGAENVIIKYLIAKYRMHPELAQGKYEHAIVAIAYELMQWEELNGN